LENANRVPARQLAATTRMELAPATRAAFAPSRPGRSGLGRAQSESEMKLGPRPKGRPWTSAEDVQLLALLNSKMDRPLTEANRHRYHHSTEGYEGERKL
jgi:hypothetical protein